MLTKDKTKEDREKVRQEIMEMGFNHKQAEIIEQFAYNELHAHWNDYLNCWGDYADLCEDVIKAQSYGIMRL